MHWQSLLSLVRRAFVPSKLYWRGKAAWLHGLSPIDNITQYSLCGKRHKMKDITLHIL